MIDGEAGRLRRRWPFRFSSAFSRRSKRIINLTMRCRRSTDLTSLYCRIQDSTEDIVAIPEGSIHKIAGGLPKGNPMSRAETTNNCQTTVKEQTNKLAMS